MLLIHKQLIATTFGLSIIPCSLGTSYAWKELNDYDNFHLDYKLKIEKASVSFFKGFALGGFYTLFSPFIIPGITIVSVHTFYKNIRRKK